MNIFSLFIIIYFEYNFILLNSFYNHRCRLNREGIDDDLLRQISESLARNNYLQHLMLHDNAITDEGVYLLSNLSNINIIIKVYCNYMLISNIHILNSIIASVFSSI
jgi:hypothetical protein